MYFACGYFYVRSLSLCAAKFGKSVVATAKGESGEGISLNIPNAKLWSPDHPNLYSLDVKVVSVQMVATSQLTNCIVSYIPNPAYTEPPGEFM